MAPNGFVLLLAMALAPAGIGYASPPPPTTIDTSFAANYTFNLSTPGDQINIVTGPVESGIQTVEIYSSLNDVTPTALANKANVTVIDTVGGITFTVDISVAAAGMTALIVNGGNGADTFDVTPSATIPFTINGGGNPQPLPGNVLFVNPFGTTGASLADTNSATGFQGSWTFTNRQPVNFNGIGTFSQFPLPAVVDTVTATSFTADLSTPGDQINIVTGPVESSLQTVEIFSSLNNFAPIAFSGKANVTVNDNAGGMTFKVDIPVAAAGMTKLTVNGGNGADTFDVTPSATIPFTINGGGNPQPSPGNVLFVDPSGTTGASLADTNSATGFQGSWTFTNRQPVNFTGIGTLEPVPPGISKAFSNPSVPLGGNTSLSFTITNPSTQGSLTGVGFTDTFPAGLAVTTPNGLSGSCGGGAITAAGGSTTVSLAGAALAAGASCTFSVNVTGILAGTQSNSVTVSSNIGTGNTATASVIVLAPPAITQSFGEISIAQYDSTSLTFAVTNPNAAGSLTGVAFTDNLPAGLIVASPNGLAGSCGAGAISAVPRSAVISLSGAALSAGATCTFFVNAEGMVTGPQTNFVTVVSANGGTGNTSTASVAVVPPPPVPATLTCPAVSSGEVGVAFSSPAIAVSGGTPPYAFSVTGTLPAGLTLNTSAGTITGTATAPGSFIVQVTDSGGVAGTDSCPFTFGLTALSNASFLVRYAANLSMGDSYIYITNTAVNGAQFYGPGYGQQSGNICVNVYAFDPGEELVACCSCLVTPDQTVNLGVNRDITIKTLTGAVPASVTVKLLASLAGGDGTGTSCGNSAATVTTATLAGGLAAWGTTLQRNPVGAYDSTEAPFTPSTLSASELTSIGGRCASILGNGSGFGACNSCRTGALAATKLAQ